MKVDNQELDNNASLIIEEKEPANNLDLLDYESVNKELGDKELIYEECLDKEDYSVKQDGNSDGVEIISAQESLIDLPKLEVVYDEPVDKPIIEIKKGGIVSKYIEKLSKENMENNLNDNYINNDMDNKDSYFDDNVCENSDINNNEDNDNEDNNIDKEKEDTFNEEADKNSQEDNQEYNNAKEIIIQSTDDLIKDIYPTDNIEVDDSIENLFNQSSIEENNIDEESEQYYENEIVVEETIENEELVTGDEKVDIDNHEMADEGIIEKDEISEGEIDNIEDEKVEEESQLIEENFNDNSAKEFDYLDKDIEDFNNEEILEEKESPEQEIIEPQNCEQSIDQKEIINNKKIVNEEVDSLQVRIANARSAFATIEKLMRELYAYVFNVDGFRPTLDECMYDLKMFLGNSANECEKGEVFTQIFGLDYKKVDPRRGGGYIPYVYKLTEYVNKNSNTDIMSKVDYLINEIYKAYE